MGINGVSEFGGFNYRVYDIPKVDLETVKAQDEARLAAESSMPVTMAPAIETPSEVAPDNRSRIADLDDISLTFNQGDDYSYIGSEVEIGDLDMQQAISDMRRDKLLEDYQYFVGSSQNLSNEFSNNDGMVFLKY